MQADLDSSLLTPDLADILFDGHFCVAEVALASGEPLERLRAVAEELHANAVRSGARRAQVFAATVLGEIALLAGRTDEAEVKLREAVRLEPRDRCVQRRGTCRAEARRGRAGAR